MPLRIYSMITYTAKIDKIRVLTYKNKAVSNTYSQSCSDKDKIKAWFSIF